MKNNSIIDIMKIITINDNSHNNTKETLREKIILIIFKPRIASCHLVNITFIMSPNEAYIFNL